MDVKYNRNYCRVCQRKNRHYECFHKKADEEDEDTQFETHFYVLECCGCGYISFKIENVELELGEADPEWEPYIFSQIYPPVLEEHRSLISSDVWDLPDNIQEIYADTLKAFAAESYLLTAVGFRAIIEATCKNLGILNGDLAKKINNLCDKGHISKKDADRLHAIRFLGNDSIHEIAPPEESQLYIVLQVVEHLLYSLYILDEKVKYELETVITNFKEFKKELNKKLRKYKSGTELTLKEILGQTYRRLNTHADQHEKGLISEITSGNYQKLKLGDKKTPNNSPNSKQYYIVL